MEEKKSMDQLQEVGDEALDQVAGGLSPCIIEEDTPESETKESKGNA